MSWSVSAQGTPAEVKEWLQPQFAASEDAVRHLPHEQHGVILAKAAIHTQLDFLIEHAPDVLVSASASGSAWISSDPKAYPSSTQTALDVRQVYVAPADPEPEATPQAA